MPRKMSRIPSKGNSIALIEVDLDGSQKRKFMAGASRANPRGDEHEANVPFS